MTEEKRDSLEQVVEQLIEAVGDVRELLDIGAARARIEVRERVFRGLAWGLFAVLLLGLTVASTVFLGRGAAGALEAWLRAPWAGDLGAGVALLLLTAGLGWAMLARLRRRGLRRIRREFGKRDVRPEAA